MKNINAIILKNINILKIFTFLICLIPLFIIIYNISINNLSSNPVEYLIKFSGKWSLNFLWISLAITPIRKLLNLQFLLRIRRMLGLFSFFYLLCHFFVWFGIDQSFDLTDISKEIIKRPFILIGFSAFILMLPLALTSSNKAIKILGGKIWQKIHNLIYIIGLFAAIHYYWIKSSKNNLNQPVLYIIIFIILISYRIYIKYKKKY